MATDTAGATPASAASTAPGSVQTTPATQPTTQEPQSQTPPNKVATFEGALLCVIVMVTDFIAVILGIEAEIAQNRMKYVRVAKECKEPSHRALSLGLTAAGLLASAHVISSLLVGCVCISSKDEWQRSSAIKKLSAASLVFSWMTVAVAFIMLVIGAMSNTNSNRPNCGFSHHNFLSIGGVLCFFHGIVCVAYYAAATTPPTSTQPPPPPPPPPPPVPQPPPPPPVPPPPPPPAAAT